MIRSTVELLDGGVRIEVNVEDIGDNTVEVSVYLDACANDPVEILNTKMHLIRVIRSDLLGEIRNINLAEQSIAAYLS